MPRTSHRPNTSSIHETAHEVFGFRELRPAQETAIQSLLAGRDTLAVLPTGSGKSAIYQIAGLLIAGPTIVISPLIALQRDQVDSLAQLGIGAVLLNSTLSISEREEALDSWKSGEAEFLFLAPEQLSNSETLQLLKQAEPSLVVIDEAHCVSEWGHDFRPDYLKLGKAIESLGHPVTLALTATAAPPVRSEIVERLAMREPHTIVSGFNRPNIWLGSRRFESEDSKREALISLVLESQRPGIVYAATRTAAEALADLLQQAGLRAAYYHGGLKAADREAAQAAFMADEVEIIVATVAFGMGIDKPNVRFVVHYDISDSIDSYYQEIGRAGRDGEPAQAILLYDPSDLNLRRFLSSGGKLAVEDVAEVLAVVQSEAAPLAPEQIAAATELSKSKASMVVNRLTEVGAVTPTASGEVVGELEMESDKQLEELAAAAAEAQERHRQFERSRIEMMQSYAELRLCRRQFLLNYFGEEFEGLCGYCDNCDSNTAVTAAQVPDDVPFPLNSRVSHADWGQGQILRYEEDKVTILFDEVGYKTLAVGIVVENDLLQTAE